MFFADPGHFYSPLCDPEELKSLELLIWPEFGSRESLGLNYNVAAQLALLQSFAGFVPDIQFPVTSGDVTQYSYDNDQFPCLDAETLFCFLRYTQPKTVIEAGSGYSSLIIAEVNRRFFNGKLNVTCIEPFPRQFLIDGVPGITQLVPEKLQRVPLFFFETLESGDILFIDSSHVSKTGSDVNWLVFEILPRLAHGVYVHIHDIFLPDDYPKKWVMDDQRNWNEQYLVRGFLQFNEAFEIVWSSFLLATRFPNETVQVFPRFPALGAGGSLWIRRT